MKLIIEIDDDFADTLIADACLAKGQTFPDAQTGAKELTKGFTEALKDLCVQGKKIREQNAMVDSTRAELDQNIKVGELLE